MIEVSNLEAGGLRREDGSSSDSPNFERRHGAADIQVFVPLSSRLHDGQAIRAGHILSGILNNVKIREKFRS